MRLFAHCALGAALIFCGTCHAHFVDFKSPGPGMHFSVGQPVIVFADLFDDNNNHGMIVCSNGQTPIVPPGGGPATCPAGGVPAGWPQLQVLVDGVLQTDAVTAGTTVRGTTDFDPNGNPDPIDFYRFSVAGLAPGPHSVVVRGHFAPLPDSDGSTLDSAPIAITIDPLPTGRTTLSLAADVAGSVNWNNLIVVGNNEFRANNRLAFEASNPDVPAIVTLSGNTPAAKLFQGNRIAAGRVIFSDTSNWTIGGDIDANSNILIGPRCTINLLSGSTNIAVRGNYSHHNYRGGWSQGFNLVASQAGSGIVIEHNVIRGSSWNIQDVAGEFRYNLIYGYGHTWLRSGNDGAAIHHNVFAPEQGGGELDQGLWFYSGESGIAIYNNTFDGGGNAVTQNFALGNFPFTGPVVQVNGSSHVASLRNNLMAYTRDYENGPGNPHVVGDSATFGTVDYNAFYSPDNTTRDNYAIAGLSEGVTPGFATHDVSGGGALGVANGQLAVSPFAGARVFPYASVVDEAAVWNRTQPLSSILSAFRARYAPAAGSPIVDAGDPADNDAHGRRADIGAIDANGHDLDLFGKFPRTDEIFANGFE